MIRASKEAVKDGFARKNMGVHGEELLDNRFPIFVPSLADTIGEQRDPDILAQRLDRGLVDADRALDSCNQQMIDLIGFDPAVQTIGLERGEGTLVEDRGIWIPESGDRFCCAPSFSGICSVAATATSKSSADCRAKPVRWSRRSRSGMVLRKTS